MNLLSVGICVYSLSAVALIVALALAWRAKQRAHLCDRCKVNEWEVLSWKHIGERLCRDCDKEDW